MNLLSGLMDEAWEQVNCVFQGSYTHGGLTVPCSSVGLPGSQWQAFIAWDIVTGGLTVLMGALIGAFVLQEVLKLVRRS